jgi:acetyl esterase/lipase
MKHFTLLALATFLYVSVFAQCTDDRYRNFSYFSESTRTTAIEFGVNESVPPFGASQGSPQSLKMDVYEPEGDQITNRPVVVVAFGGSFIGGSRGQMESLCREFARLGYVAVAPDYRVGLFFPIDELNTTLAVLRGAHDMKGCVRYLRKTVAEDGNPYGIDPDMIFVGGVSAGAISAIHAAYLDDLATEIPDYLVNDTAGLGGLEGNTGPLEYTSEVQGVFSYSGTIGDTSWIAENDVPIISFHEEGDGVVPYATEEIAVSGIPTGLIASGSFDLHIRAENAGMDNCFTGYPGNGHVGFLGNSNYNEVLGKTADFLADIVCGEPIDCGEVLYDGNTSVNQLEVNEVKLYPNPASDFMVVDFSESSHELNSWTLIDLQGKSVLEGVFSSVIQKIDVSSVESGSYVLRAWGKEALGEMPLVIQ